MVTYKMNDPQNSTIDLCTMETNVDPDQVVHRHIVMRINTVPYQGNRELTLSHLQKKFETYTANNI